jgi:predicted nucleic acid-binding protein
VRRLAELLADSYAFFELYTGNERYLRIFRSRSVVTTALNVLEVYRTLLRRTDRARALTEARKCLGLVVPVPPEDALSAAELKHRMNNERVDCSYVDAWGYATARAIGVPFLTGDPAFRGLDNVEFVR